MSSVHCCCVIIRKLNNFTVQWFSNMLYYWGNYFWSRFPYCKNQNWTGRQNRQGLQCRGAKHAKLLHSTKKTDFNDNPDKYGWFSLFYFQVCHIELLWLGQSMWFIVLSYSSCTIRLLSLSIALSCPALIKSFTLRTWTELSVEFHLIQRCKTGHGPNMYNW